MLLVGTSESGRLGSNFRHLPSGTTEIDGGVPVAGSIMPDVNPWVQVAGAALGAAIGGMATFAGVLAAQWMTYRREYVLTERQVREARERRWAEFQAKSLVELQEALAELMTEAFY